MQKKEQTCISVKAKAISDALVAVPRSAAKKSRVHLLAPYIFTLLNHLKNPDWYLIRVFSHVDLTQSKGAIKVRLKLTPRAMFHNANNAGNIRKNARKMISLAKDSSFVWNKILSHQRMDRSWPSYYKWDFKLICKYLVENKKKDWRVFLLVVFITHFFQEYFFGLGIFYFRFHDCFHTGRLINERNSNIYFLLLLLSEQKLQMEL